MPPTHREFRITVLFLLLTWSMSLLLTHICREYYLEPHEDRDSCMYLPHYKTQELVCVRMYDFSDFYLQLFFWGCILVSIIIVGYVWCQIETTKTTKIN